MELTQTNSRGGHGHHQPKLDTDVLRWAALERDLLGHRASRDSSNEGSMFEEVGHHASSMYRNKTTRAPRSEEERAQIRRSWLAQLGWEEPPESDPERGQLVSCITRWRQNALTVVTSKWFDSAIGALILLNSVTIGVGLQEQMSPPDFKQSEFSETLELMFLGVYTFEVCLQFIGQGCACLRSNWVKADCFFVALGYLTQTTQRLEVDDLPVGPLMVLRMLRLLRIARPLRLLYKFKELWTLISGLLASAGTMVYTMSLIVMILYIFACIGVELVFKRVYGPEASPELQGDAEFVALVDKHFNSLPVAMLTLVQFIAMDSVSGIYWTLITKDPWLIVYFSFVIVIVSVVLMNLVTAVVVENALDNASKDKEARRCQELEENRLLVMKLHQMMTALDEDKSGKISLMELTRATHATKDLLIDLVNVETPMEVFEELNLDPAQEVAIDHLCERIMQIVNYDGTPPMRRIERTLERINQRMDGLESTLTWVSESLTTAGHDCCEEEAEKAPPPNGSNGMVEEARPSLKSAGLDSQESFRPAPKKGPRRRSTKDRLRLSKESLGTMPSVSTEQTAQFTLANG
eukprot:TRINITY_DN28543_c0_g1_i1.p1 TRINITY_DN28543_c0_g1~~TRINITY_DN28543_c0_g1_i1.p1  ORF type:complete len:579 (-),score=128.94 TRINITY_DN28543_c0_g1_i1:143-1879(-)